MDQLYRLTIDEYHRLIGAGAFENMRVELIDGLLVEMSPKGDAHDGASVWINEFLVLGLDLARFKVGVTTSLVLERSEPEPDFTVFAVDAPFRRSAVLVIEVSASSLRHDLHVKTRVYAQAGVPEYWAVDVNGRRIVRHLDPAGHGYLAVDEFRGGDVLVATAVALPPLDLRELFAFAYR
jgi:Uma2 family endonuclease